MKVGKYMVAYLFEGKVERFLDSLQREVSEKFGTRKIFDHISPHVTLKAPFVVTNENHIDTVLKDFAQKNSSASLNVSGYGKFRNDVIFAEVRAKEHVYEMLEELQRSLTAIEGVEHGVFEHKRHLHATITSKKLDRVFDDIWNFLHEKESSQFEVTFDHVALLKRGETMWGLVQKYPLK